MNIYIQLITVGNDLDGSVKNKERISRRYLSTILGSTDERGLK